MSDRLLRQRLAQPLAVGAVLVSVCLVALALPGRAQAAVDIAVPCTGLQPLTAAIDQANALGGRTITLAARCIYTFAAPDIHLGGYPAKAFSAGASRAAFR